MARAWADVGRGAGAAGLAGRNDEAGFGEASINGFTPDGVSANGAGPAGGSDGGGAGASADVVTSTWAWPALAAILVPGIAFAIAMLVG